MSEIVREPVKVADYAGTILKELRKGILLTSKADGRVNCMVIGWGFLGVEWGEDVFVALIREGRFTRELLDKNPEFTVNVPLGKYDRNIIKVCGHQSGRSLDKVKELGLTLIGSETIAVPAVKELPLTLECRVLYRKLQDKEQVPPAIRDSMYPEDVPSSDPMGNHDYHVEYIAKIERAYILRQREA